MSLRHDGGGAPWATVRVRAAVPLQEPLNAGYRIRRTMSIVKAADPKRLVRGDVVKIRIEVTAAAGRTWVIVNDPIPPGATIVGNLGGQSDMLADQADGRSEEHTSELQSLMHLSYAVFCLKKKTTNKYTQ